MGRDGVEMAAVDFCFNMGLAPYDYFMMFRSVNLVDSGDRQFSDVQQRSHRD